MRGVMHYMQRTAIQGSPDVLTAITGAWVSGAKERPAPAHPFTRSFQELEIGETIHTKSRSVTLEDIEHFARFTGDTFYAHMDEDAAKEIRSFPDGWRTGICCCPLPPVCLSCPTKGRCWPIPVWTGCSS